MPLRLRSGSARIAGVVAGGMSEPEAGAATAAATTAAAATLRAEAALGAIRRPLATQSAVDVTDASHQQILIDAAVATLQAGHAGRPSPNQEPVPATRTDAHTDHTEHP
jgi:hypothetical protein